MKLARRLGGIPQALSKGAGREEAPEVGALRDPAPDSLLSVRGLTVRYGVITALRGVNVDVAPGRSVAIIGPNGAGKTTFARAVMRNIPSAAGRVFFEGTSIAGTPTFRLVRRGLTLVPEGRGVLPTLTVEENLRVAACRHDYVPEEGGGASTLQDVYERLPLLGPLRHRPAGQLSGGQLQLLAIARALMSAPKLLLLDEPSMGLSPHSVKQVDDVIRSLQTRARSILLLEQNARLAFNLADYVYVLDRGEIGVEGTPDELMNDPVVRESYLPAGFA